LFVPKTSSTNARSPKAARNPRTQSSPRSPQGGAGDAGADAVSACGGGSCAQASYLTIEGVASAQITEKKSRFIANLTHVTTEDEAAGFIAKIRAENPDARHNVYAYTLKNGRSKSSDDSEPSGTAGRPTLEALTHANLTDVVCVTTRYFGGILLGTGGLTRAYSDAAAAAINVANIVEMAPCQDVRALLEYSQLDPVLHAARAAKIAIVDTLYTDKVDVTFRVRAAQTEGFLATLRELTSGAASPEVTPAYFAPL
jgi:uncharacterized YigZ family protein